MKRILKIFGFLYSVTGFIVLLVSIVIYLRSDGNSEYKSLYFTLIPIGLVFFLIGVALLFWIYRKERIKRTLISSGRVIYAQIQGVDINYRVRYNGKCPYNITCSWNDSSTNITYFFTSENLMFDPSPVLNEQGIQEIQVYIDPNHIKRYYVNTEPIESRVVIL